MEIKIKWIKRKQMTHENTYRDDMYIAYVCQSHFIRMRVSIDPPSRVHSQLSENVPEESCTLMEEEDQHKDHYIIAANHVLCKLLIT